MTSQPTGTWWGVYRVESKTSSKYKVSEVVHLEKTEEYNNMWVNKIRTGY